MEIGLAVLVTGGVGYIGSHAAHALVDRGQETIVVDDLSAGGRLSIPAHAAFSIATSAIATQSGTSPRGVEYGKYCVLPAPP